MDGRPTKKAHKQVSWRYDMRNLGRWAAALALAAGLAATPAIAAADTTPATPAGDIGWGAPPVKPTPTPSPTPSPSPTVGTAGDIGWG
ncbi:hypothetical protein [Streptomyces sp. NPDC001054]